MPGTAQRTLLLLTEDDVESVIAQLILFTDSTVIGVLTKTSSLVMQGLIPTYYMPLFAEGGEV